MSRDTRDANDPDLLVNLAIYDYHAALDRGESPDPAEWAARYPDFGVELKAYFDDLAAFDLIRPQPALAPQAATTALVEPGPVIKGPGPKAAHFRPGDVLGEYVLLEQLGEGGQGVVWKARPKQSPEIVVALKTLRGPATNDAASVHRLRQDAEAIARMKNDNIIRTFFVGEDRGRWFFVMELMEGGTLEERLESYKANPRSAAVLTEKIARAIHHAHTRNPGVLHLDLKPGNILLTSTGEPKVTDFGLSTRFNMPEPSGQDEASAGAIEASSESFAIVGTIPFMSPEMAAGRWSEISTGSDVYGLGAILYAMLTSRPPFRAASHSETLALLLKSKPKSPRDLNRKVDRELAAVCLKCLERDPKQRYGSGDALANDIGRWLERRPTLAGAKPSAAREVRFWMRRHPLRLAVACVAAFALWLASLAVSMANLRTENGREAQRLASQIDRELRLIRRATQIVANDPRLRAAFAALPATAQAGQRRAAIEAYLRAAVEQENLFGIAGGNPFVNVFVLDPAGVLMADTLPNSPAVGRDYRVRDYCKTFFENDWPRDHVYVARSFLSVKDNRYKIAVSTRIWDDRDKLLGSLVANFTIGPRLIDVDIRQEPGDAAVLCPMDQSDPVEGIANGVPPWRYISVLDRRYTADGTNRPFMVDSPPLLDFQNDPKLNHVTGGPDGGKLVDYHRVGQTHMVIVMRRPCPWPLSWLSFFTARFPA